MTSVGWQDGFDQRARRLQDALVRTAAWAKTNGGGDQDFIEAQLRPFRSMLETIYKRDYPLASLAERADLVLHVVGPGAEGPQPRVSVLTNLLTSARDEVTRFAKQRAGLSARARVPAALDMAFAGVAEGSLFVGFSAIDQEEGGDGTRDAVNTIARVAALVADDAPIDEILLTVPDPAERDIALAAVRRLSPSGHFGVRSIDLFGRSVGTRSELTVTTRRAAHGIMSRPPKKAEPPQAVTVVGTVRELDLDERRFALRNVAGHPDDDIRCAHELTEEEAKRLIDQRVRVTGVAELGKGDAIRLVWVSEIEVVE